MFEERMHRVRANRVENQNHSD